MKRQAVGEGTAPELALLYTLAGSEAAAREMARVLLDERLIACANILPACASLYEWQGAQTETRETPMLCKVTAAGAQAAAARMAELHDYELPAILILPVEAAHGPFARWVEGQTGGGAE